MMIDYLALALAQDREEGEEELSPTLVYGLRRALSPLLPRQREGAAEPSPAGEVEGEGPQAVPGPGRGGEKALSGGEEASSAASEPEELLWNQTSSRLGGEVPVLERALWRAAVSLLPGRPAGMDSREGVPSREVLPLNGETGWSALSGRALPALPGELFASARPLPSGEAPAPQTAGERGDPLPLLTALRRAWAGESFVRSQQRRFAVTLPEAAPTAAPAWTVEDLDRAVERDARRYGGGTPLY